MKKPSHAPTLLVQPSQRESVGSNTSWMERRPVSEKQAPQAFYEEGDAPAACLVNENGPAGGGPASSQVGKPHPHPPPQNRVHSQRKASLLGEQLFCFSNEKEKNVKTLRRTHTLC